MYSVFHHPQVYKITKLKLVILLLYRLGYRAHFFLKFIQVFKENFIFTSVIFCLSWLVVQSRRVFFSITFWSSCIMKLFKPSTLNMSKRSRSVFSSISIMLHQWVPSLSSLSVFAMIKGYFPFFFWNHCLVVYKPIHAVCWEHTHKIFIHILVV